MLAASTHCHALTLENLLVLYFWLGQGVTRVGSLVFYFLCWPGMVPNQRQLSIVVSDWGSYLDSLFSPVVGGILILFCCFLALQSCTFILLLFLVLCRLS
jgi:hypothetical protein